jgi:hypothetical protein
MSKIRVSQQRMGSDCRADGEQYTRYRHSIVTVTADGEVHSSNPSLFNAVRVVWNVTLGRFIGVPREEYRGIQVNNK